MTPIRRLASLALLGAVLTSAAPVTNPIKEPDKLIILSLTDVLGRIKPCGCDIPKGGVSRHASFVDSVRHVYDQVLVVDNGSYFPDSATEATALFMMETMRDRGFGAVGTGARDLRFGLDYLRDNVRRTGLPQVSSNLYVRALNKPALTPHLIKEVGTVRVGVFSLISDRMDLGPSRALLEVKDPFESAKNAVAALRDKGATVVVLLSQLGKVDTEELIGAVEGIDVAIVGLNSPMLPLGRTLGKTVLAYGGEQGQHVASTIVTLDAARRMASGAGEVFRLGHEVGESAAYLERVKAFEESQKTAGAKAAAAPARQ